LDKKKVKAATEEKTLTIEIRPDGTEAMLLVKSAELGLVELIQPTGAGGTIVDMVGLSGDVTTDGGTLFAITVAIGSRPGKYQIRLTLSMARQQAHH
jgi:hypothetical protein